MSRCEPSPELKFGSVLLRVSLVVSIGCVLPSCGSEPTQVEEGLSAAEVQSLVEALHATHAFDLQFDAANPWPCPGGGTVSRVLGISFNESGTLHEASLGYTDCVATSVSGGTFTLSGNLSVSLQFDLASGAPREGGAGGEVSWRLAGRSGACLLNLAITWDQSGGRVAGSACGIQVDQRIS